MRTSQMLPLHHPKSARLKVHNRLLRHQPRSRNIPPHHFHKAGHPRPAPHLASDVAIPGNAVISLLVLWTITVDLVAATDTWKAGEAPRVVFHPPSKKGMKPPGEGQVVTGHVRILLANDLILDSRNTMNGHFRQGRR